MCIRDRVSTQSTWGRELNFTFLKKEINKQKIIIMIFTYLNYYVSALSEKIDLPPDQIRLVIAIFAMVPIGLAFQKIRQEFPRRIMSIALGFFFQYFLFENELYVPLVQTIIVYLLIIILKEKCGKVIFYESFFYLIGYQTYKMITEYTVWRMSVDMVLMIDTAKYTIIAFNISDGLNKGKKLTKEQQSKALFKIPSFLDYLSYIQFYASSLMGPVFEYKEFDNFMKFENEFKEVPFLESLKYSLLLIGKGFAYIGFFLVTASKFPVSVVDSDEFGSRSFVYKLIYFNFAVLFIRFRYYGGFLLCESSNIASGLGYSGKDEKTNLSKWDRVQQAKPSEIELSTNMRNKINNWNMTAQKWLRYYVYDRLYTEEQYKSSKALQARGQFLTFVFSALWHGLYPGYIISFIQWFIQVNLNQKFYKMNLNYPQYMGRVKKFLGNKVYYAITLFIVNSAFNSGGTGFWLLTFEKNWKFLANLYYVTVILQLGLFIFFAITQFGQRPPRPQVQKAENNTEKKEM
eukprot:TRINITY_DN2701_c0_g1_i2.p1 TRINITY_DN2701_c0_g1~~TRINITY_DN2701_c0_g1_i2.p1  ORF type:complete len:527 (+),score=80.38 TRINITY_DN2701_c0_g1_i2:33-1583(+)